MPSQFSIAVDIALGMDGTEVLSNMAQKLSDLQQKIDTLNKTGFKGLASALDQVSSKVTSINDQIDRMTRSRSVDINVNKVGDRSALVDSAGHPLGKMAAEDGLAERSERSIIRTLADDITSTQTVRSRQEADEIDARVRHQTRIMREAQSDNEVQRSRRGGERKDTPDDSTRYQQQIMRQMQDDIASGQRSRAREQAEEARLRVQHQKHIMRQTQDDIASGQKRPRQPSELENEKFRFFDLVNVSAAGFTIRELTHAIGSLGGMAAQTQRSLAALRTQGMSEQDVEAAHAQALRVSGQTYGGSEHEFLDTRREVGSIIGPQNVTDSILKLSFNVAKLATMYGTPETASTVATSITQLVEAQGITKNGELSPEAFEHGLERVSVMMRASGGTVSFRDLAETMRYEQMSLKNSGMTEDQQETRVLTARMRFGGHANEFIEHTTEGLTEGAVAKNDALMRFIGSAQMAKGQAGFDLSKLTFVGRNFNSIGGGGGSGWQGNAFKWEGDLKNDPTGIKRAQFFMDVVKEHAKQTNHGVADEQAIASSGRQLFGSEQYFHDIQALAGESYQASEREIEARKKKAEADRNWDQHMQDPISALTNFRAKLENVVSELFVFDDMVKVLDFFSSGLQKAAEFLHDHKGLAKTATTMGEVGLLAVGTLFAKAILGRIGRFLGLGAAAGGVAAGEGAAAAATASVAGGEAALVGAGAAAEEAITLSAGIALIGRVAMRVVGPLKWLGLALAAFEGLKLFGWMFGGSKSDQNAPNANKPSGGPSADQPTHSDGVMSAIEIGTELVMAYKAISWVTQAVPRFAEMIEGATKGLSGFGDLLGKLLGKIGAPVAKIGERISSGLIGEGVGAAGLAGAPAATLATGILAAGAAAGALESPMTDDYGRVVGNFGGKDESHNPANPLYTPPPIDISTSDLMPLDAHTGSSQAPTTSSAAPGPEKTPYGSLVYHPHGHADIIYPERHSTHRHLPMINGRYVAPTETAQGYIYPAPANATEGTRAGEATSTAPQVMVTPGAIHAPSTAPQPGSTVNTTSNASTDSRIANTTNQSGPVSNVASTVNQTNASNVASSVNQTGPVSNSASTVNHSDTTNVASTSAAQQQTLKKEGSQPQVPDLVVRDLYADKIVVDGGRTSVASRAASASASNAAQGDSRSPTSASGAFHHHNATSNSHVVNSSRTVIAGERVVPGRPLSSRQMAAISASPDAGSKYSSAIMAQYNAQRGDGSISVNPSSTLSNSTINTTIGDRQRAIAAQAGTSGAALSAQDKDILNLGNPGYQSAPGEPDVQSSPISVAPKAVYPSAYPSTNRSDAMPRGISNNNPLNLTFAGQAGATSDGRFAKFGTMAAGIAADANQIIRNQDVHHTDTLAQQIMRWSPPSENNTRGYIDYVSKAMGVDPNARLDFHDPKVLTTMITAMSHVENGRDLLNPQDVASGVAAATGEKAPTTQQNHEVAESIRGPSVNEDNYKNMPTNNHHISMQIDTHIDGEHVASNMARRLFDTSPAGLAGLTGFDSRRTALPPGTSIRA